MPSSLLTRLMRGVLRPVAAFVGVFNVYWAERLLARLGKGRHTGGPGDSPPDEVYPLW